MEQSPSTATSPNPVGEVACPQCDEPTTVPVPDSEVEPKASPYAVAFGEHSVVRCPTEHKFWVYYC